MTTPENKFSQPSAQTKAEKEPGYKVMAIDDQPDEINRQWEDAIGSNDHTLIPVTKFESIEDTWEQIKKEQPNMILVGFGLGVENVTGADVIKYLTEQGYAGIIITNSGGGNKHFSAEEARYAASANKNAKRLSKLLSLHPETYKGQEVESDEEEQKQKDNKKLAQLEKEMKELLKSNKTEEAKKIIESIDNYFLSIRMCSLILDNDDSPQELIDQGFNKLLTFRLDEKGEQAGFVHDTSHLMIPLIKHNQHELLKKLSKTIFNGLLEDEGDSFTGRFISKFSIYDEYWDQDPADYGITDETINKSDLSEKNMKISRARLQAGKFESFEKFFEWQDDHQ